MTEAVVFTGGCQCGAVRFRVENVGRASIFHCRMCQKAFGNFFAPLVSALPNGFSWTRGEPKWFRSSSLVSRGFCANCGTPLAYRHPQGLELAIGAFDRPEEFEPQVQVNHASRLSWIDHLFEKPAVPQVLQAESFTSYQHPDHDKAVWSPEGEE